MNDLHVTAEMHAENQRIFADIMKGRPSKLQEFQHKYLQNQIEAQQEQIDELNALMDFREDKPMLDAVAEFNKSRGF